MRPATQQVPANAMAMALPVLLATTAAAVAIAQQAMGVRLIDTHDGTFAVGVTQYVHDALAQGVMLPRWITQAYGGLGSPIFYFYPPGAYLVSGGLMAVIPGLTAAGAVGAACTLFRVLSMLTATAWLRRHLNWGAAVTGGALYALMPYIAYVNPQVRLALGETAAGALLPLLFLAIDLGTGRTSRTALLLGPAMGALALTHLPTTVLAGGLAVAYAAFSADTQRAALGRAGATIGGLALGLAMAGFTVVPALLLQDSVQMDRMRTAFFDPELNLLFDPTSIMTALDYLPWLVEMHMAVLTPTLAALLAWRLTPGRRSPWQRGCVLSLLLAFVLVTPAGVLAWRYLPILGRVQFPFRLALAMSLFGAGAVAMGWQLMTRRVRCGLYGTATAIAILWVSLAWYHGDAGRSDVIRTLEMIALGGGNVNEYIPAAARDFDWQGVTDNRPGPLQRLARELSGCAGQSGLPAELGPGRVTISLLGCVGDVVLPQFYFPGWRGPEGLADPAPDPATGLVRMTVPPGVQQIELRREILPQELTGRSLSVVALLLWILCAAWCWRRHAGAMGKAATTLAPAYNRAIAAAGVAGRSRRTHAP